MTGQRRANQAFQSAFGGVGGHTLFFLIPFNTPIFILFLKNNQ